MADPRSSSVGDSTVNSTHMQSPYLYHRDFICVISATDALPLSRISCHERQGKGGSWRIPSGSKIEQKDKRWILALTETANHESAFGAERLHDLSDRYVPEDRSRSYSCRQNKHLLVLCSQYRKLAEI